MRKPVLVPAELFCFKRIWTPSMPPFQMPEATLMARRIYSMPLRH